METTTYFLSIVSLIFGFLIGYFVRKIFVKRRVEGIEAELEKKILNVKEESKRILEEAKKRAEALEEKVKKEYELRKDELSELRDVLLKREKILEKRILELERKEEEIKKKEEEIEKLKGELKEIQKREEEQLYRITRLSKEEAKEELFRIIEEEYKKDILTRIKKLEEEGEKRYEVRAKDILLGAIQKCALSQAQEFTTTTVFLPSDDLKGRIIGKEGRNIRALEQLTGVEILIDETPETVTISSFNPIRREIAKLALEKLIRDGRIQPARIEEKVKEAEEEVSKKIKEAGEKAVYEVGILDLNPKLVELLGRLYFRTSYGQNVLLHSMEVAILAEAIASEIGLESKVCKKAGLLHDIGKALDHQVQGSHTDIGIRILERFNIEKEVISAMKSHHEEYPIEIPEAVVVMVADQISGARPGARRETLESYLQRLEELENIALSFDGVEKAYAISAGRELRVFVDTKKIDDFKLEKLAREIAKRIEEELVYPGEIKVTAIREKKVVEYAK
jgi:ribonuclease Y